MNRLFAIPLAILRILVRSSNNASINCFQNLYICMRFFRSAEYEIVPVIELKRCEIYPCSDDVSPLVVLLGAGFHLMHYQYPITRLSKTIKPNNTHFVSCAT